MKIVLFLLIIAGLGSLGAASMMPEIAWFNFQGVEVLEGKAEILQSGGEFVCQCVDMLGEADECDLTVPGGDFCSACNVGGEGQECNVAPNVEGPYFNSAVLCDAPTTCP